ncbi:MAG: hypothetical protein ABSE40_09610 [Candidatus Sulfotelmatobacter sp.]
MLQYSFNQVVPQDLYKSQNPIRNAVLTMTATQVRLCERLKRLGFSRANQIKLYGAQFELVGDPLVMGDNVVFVDAIEQKSRQLRRVRIPLNIVRMATDQTADGYAA